nr:hypothetical protein [Vibrio vulnificus]
MKMVCGKVVYAALTP